MLVEVDKSNKGSRIDINDRLFRFKSIVNKSALKTKYPLKLRLLASASVVVDSSRIIVDR